MAGAFVQCPEREDGTLVFAAVGNGGAGSGGAGSGWRGDPGNALKESPDYELLRLTTQTPGVLRRDGEKAGRELGEGAGGAGKRGGGTGEGD